MAIHKEKIREDAERGPFGEIVARLLPEGVRFARLQRLVDVTSPHFYGLMAGERDGKPVRPSPEMAARFISALTELGANVSRSDAEAMMEMSVRLPEGYRVVKDVDHLQEPPENFADWPQELQEALGYARDMTPEVQKYIFHLWREQARAHHDIEMRRQDAERRLIEREQQLEALEKRQG